MKQPLTTFEHRNFRFPTEIWPLLEQLAAETKSMAKRGTNARGPSVNVMLERIARREIILTEARPCALLAQLTALEEQQHHDARRQQACAAAAEKQEQEREQQRHEQALDDARRQQACCPQGGSQAAEKQEQAKAVRKVPVKMQQLHMELEPA